MDCKLETFFGHLQPSPKGRVTRAFLGFVVGMREGYGRDVYAKKGAQFLPASPLGEIQHKQVLRTVLKVLHDRLIVGFVDR